MRTRLFAAQDYYFSFNFRAEFSKMGQFWPVSLRGTFDAAAQFERAGDTWGEEGRVAKLSNLGHKGESLDLFVSSLY